MAVTSWTVPYLQSLWVVVAWTRSCLLGPVGGSHIDEVILMAAKTCGQLLAVQGFGHCCLGPTLPGPLLMGRRAAGLHMGWAAVSRGNKFRHFLGIKGRYTFPVWL